MLAVCSSHFAVGTFQLPGVLFLHCPSNIQPYFTQAIWAILAQVQGAGHAAAQDPVQ